MKQIFLSFLKNILGLIFHKKYIFKLFYKLLRRIYSSLSNTRPTSTLVFDAVFPFWNKLLGEDNNRKYTSIEQVWLSRFKEHIWATFNVQTHWEDINRQVYS